MASPVAVFVSICHFAMFTCEARLFFEPSRTYNNNYVIKKMSQKNNQHDHMTFMITLSLCFGKLRGTSLFIISSDFSSSLFM